MNRIPEPIAAIIEAETQRINAERRAEKRAEEKKRNEILKRGRAYLADWVKTQLEKVPEYMRPYYSRINDTTDRRDDELAMSYGHENVHEPEFTLIFDVPDLSPLVYSPKNGQWACMRADFVNENQSNNYRGQVEWLNWWNAYLRCETLELTLVRAEDEYENYKSLIIQQEEWQAARNKRRQDDEKEAEEIRKRSEEQALVEATEDEMLFEALSTDPVAVLMMKTFLAIRQDREMLLERITEADDSLYSAEERWSRKADDLRRRAEDADRRAAEERNRASDLEDDLDDVQKKLKKAERGW